MPHSKDTGGPLPENKAFPSAAILEKLNKFWYTKDLSYRDDLLRILNCLWPASAGNEKLGSDSQVHILPFLCNQALGGDESTALAVCAAWSQLYIALYLLDKVEDREDNALFSTLGVSPITNLTTGMIFGSESLLLELASESAIDPHRLTTILMHYNQMMLSVCAGQHLDLTLVEPNLSQAWQITTEKSGTFFAAGCLIGALAATVDEARYNSMKEFGWHLGVLVQIANDIGGLWEQEKKSDLIDGKWTLPVAYAFSVLPEEKKNVLWNLIHNSSNDAAAEREARRMVVDCGALVYLWLEIEKHKQKAERILDSLQLHPNDADQLLFILRQVAHIENRGRLKNDLGK